jgi:hypothetical protein
MAKGPVRVILLLGSLLEAVALLRPGVARSVEPPAASPSSGTASTDEGLSEVVVTARFKSENLLSMDPRYHDLRPILHGL